MSKFDEDGNLTQIDISRDRPGPLREYGGSENDDFNKQLIVQTVYASFLGDHDSVGGERARQAALAALKAVAPRDEFEGILATQFVGLHNAQMECLRRAMTADSVFAMENLNQAARLSRAITTLVETIDRHRRQGRQKIEVKHVHVNESAQPVTAVVNGGDKTPAQAEEKANEPKAPIDQAEMPMWRTDPERELVPVAAGAGTDPLPNARRRSR